MPSITLPPTYHAERHDPSERGTSPRDNAITSLSGVASARKVPHEKNVFVHFESPTTATTDVTALLLSMVSKESLTWQGALLPFVRNLVSHGALRDAFKLADIVPLLEFSSALTSRSRERADGELLRAAEPVLISDDDLAFMMAVTGHVASRGELRVSLEEDGDVD